MRDVRDKNKRALFLVLAALAIHDTSSVVGATVKYGPEALAKVGMRPLAQGLLL